MLGERENTSARTRTHTSSASDATPPLFFNEPKEKDTLGARFEPSNAVIALENN